MSVISSPSDASLWQGDLHGRIVSIDMETTNFPHLPETRIIEFGAVEILDGQLTDNRYSSYVACSEASVPGAFNIHQLTVDFLMSKGRPIEEALEGFMEFIGDSPLLCHGFWHGVNCDEEVVNNELMRQGRTKLTNPIIQTTDIFGFVSLQNLCKRYGVHSAGTHNALRDAEMLAECFLAFHRGTASTTCHALPQVHYGANSYVGSTAQQSHYTPQFRHLGAASEAAQYGGNSYVGSTVQQSPFIPQFCHFVAAGEAAQYSGNSYVGSTIQQSPFTPQFSHFVAAGEAAQHGTNPYMGVTVWQSSYTPQISHFVAAGEAAQEDYWWSGSTFPRPSTQQSRRTFLDPTTMDSVNLPPLQ
jgi:DNA polymerase-3 subunit epsilon